MEAVAPGPALSDGDGSTHRLTGTVVREDGSPLPSAIVRIMPGNLADTTAADGSFSFQGLGPGDYTITAVMPDLGLEDARRTVAVPGEEARLVMRELTYRIDEIVVVSGRRDDSLPPEDIPSSVTLVDRDDFERKAATVADVLAATPSAHVSVMGGLGDYSEVSLRGSYSNQVQVYLDGMLLNEAVGGAVNLNTMPLTNVERIEVWRSGATGEYGGDAAGGVVNIVTADAGVPRRTVSLGYGSFGTFTANTVLDIPRERSKFMLSADFASSENDFSYKSDNGTMYNSSDDYRAKRHNDEYRSTNLMGKYRRLFGSSLLLEVSEHFLTTGKNLPRADNARYSNASLETRKNLFQVRATIDRFPADFLDMKPAFHHIFTREHYRDPDGSVGWGVQDNLYETQSFQLHAPIIARAGTMLALTVTPEARYETFDPENRLQTTIPLSCGRKQAALTGYAVVRLPGDRVTFTTTVKRTRYDSSYEGYPSAVNRKTPKSTTHRLTTIQGGLRIGLTDMIELRGNAGSLNRAPSFYELFGDRGGTLSNPDLKPEHIERWDAGVRLNLGGLPVPISGSVECVRFHNRFENLIQWYTTDAGFIHPDNVGGSFVRGTELIWHTRLSGFVSFSGSWTFQTSKVTDDKRVYYRDKRLPNRPESYGNLTTEMPIRRARLFWTVDRKGSYFLDRSNQAHKLYPGRTLHDAGVSFPLFFDGLDCSVVVKNITDIHTFDILGMPKPGRSYMLTLTYALTR